MWPFKKNKAVQQQPAQLESVAQKSAKRPHDGGQALDPNAFINRSPLLHEEEKGFSWYHYDRDVGNGGGMFQNEFNTHNAMSMQMLRRVYASDDLIQTAVEAVARQFLGCSFQVMRQKDGKPTPLPNHPILEILHNPQPGDTGNFHAENVTECHITGTNYCLWIPDEKTFRRLPSDAVWPEIDRITGEVLWYNVSSYNDDTGITKNHVPPDEMWVFKMPNIYSRHVGLSAIISAVLPALVNKYSLEYIVGFFLRGGNMTGVIQCEKNDTTQLSRLILSIQQLMGSRRNMHNDKYLPKDAKWVSASQKFSDIQIIEIIKQNRRIFNSRLGVPPVMVGDTDGVNYANSESQMNIFWEQTVLPLQKMYCRSLENSFLGPKYLRPGEWLELDNSGVKYLDETGKLLEQDVKFAGILTVNERRARLGYLPLKDEAADTTPGAMQPNPFNLAQAGKRCPLFKALGDTLEPTEKVEKVFHDEFKGWIDIFVKNWDDKNAAQKEIMQQSEAYLVRLTDALYPFTKATYAAHVADTKRRSAKSMVQTKADVASLLDGLYERSESFLYGTLAGGLRRNFLGYSDTASERVYDFISKYLLENPMANQVEIASAVREKFGEAYQSQANTIIRTELGSAASFGTHQFSNDIQSVSAETIKRWDARLDIATRDDHRALDNKIVAWKQGDAVSLTEKTFENDLRYPRDSRGSAAEVINCRCVIHFEVKEWKE